MTYSRHAALLFLLVPITALLLFAAGADTTMQEAVAALQRQNYPDAELKLREALKAHPGDAQTLSLLGVALDQQSKFEEAGTFHRRAVASAPGSTAALYNYANHLLATGDETGARSTLLKSVAIDASDRNSNLALAQLAVKRKDGKEALLCLDRIRNPPETMILRVSALELTARHAEAAALFEQVSNGARNDSRLSVAYGESLAKAGQFDWAEALFTQGLAADPTNVQIMYRLGVTAYQAGHNERARVVLDAALRKQPDNVDIIYAIAAVCNANSQPEDAIRYLATAGKLAPQRADIQKLTAIVARNIKADEDAVAAWDRYLKLVPNDDEARRERAFEKARLALLDEAMPDLRAYTTRHPDDAMGFYELGMAESADDPEKAIETLSHAIALKSDLVVARAGRGILLYTQNKPEAALPDLQFAVEKIPAGAPERAPILDRLGQVLVALNRVSDAIPVLRQASELTPNDAPALLHLANALAEAGQTDESDKLMARFRQMNSGARAPKVSGVVDYLTMTQEQRHDLYRSRLTKIVHDHPEDTKSQILYLKLLLTDRQMRDAADAARKFADLKPGTLALADVGHSFLVARQYGVARELLQLAANADLPGVRTDLALASLRERNSSAAAADEGLRQLDAVPESDRDAAYFSARSQMLAAAGRSEEAIAAIERAIQETPRDLTLYWQASVLMMASHRTESADSLLRRAAQILPDDPKTQMLLAVGLAIEQKFDEAQKVLSDAQRRWPEVAGIWAVQGFIFAAAQKYDLSSKALETAVALGSRNPETDLAVQAMAARVAESRKLSRSTAAGSDHDASDLAALFSRMPPWEW
jgi:tetratricopeptide (TPR) repeat protein